MHGHKIIPVCHKGVGSDASLLPVNIPQNAATTICGSVQKLAGEVSRLWIQNIGANGCYFSLNADCTLGNADGYLSAQGAPIELTPFMGSVSCFCTAATGTIVVAVRLVSLDNNSTDGIIPAPNQLNVPG